jgi:hypothetical protein
MRFIPAAVFPVFLLLAGSTSWAQRAPDPTGFGRVSNPAGVAGTTGGAGFGRMIYPGTGAPAVARNPRIPGAPLAALPPPQVVHRAHGTVPVAVPYPVFYGGNYYDYDAPAAPVAGYSQYQSTGYDQMTQPPVVIINQYFRPDTANPVLRDYSNVPLPEPAAQTNAGDAAVNTSDQQVMFLIAMKDHTIFPAVAYWVEGDTLNYITVQGVKNSASLDLVDREFSKQINKERKVDFGLPGK